MVVQYGVQTLLDVGFITIINTVKLDVTVTLKVAIIPDWIYEFKKKGQ